MLLENSCEGRRLILACLVLFTVGCGSYDQTDATTRLGEPTAEKPADDRPVTARHAASERTKADASAQAVSDVPGGGITEGGRKLGLRGELLFHSDREGRDNLYVLNLPTGVVRRLTSGTEYRDSDPSWSPDGTKIAFASTRYGSQWEIAMMDADGSNIVRLTENPGDDTDPVWSPDGESIIFGSERDGRRSEMYRLWLKDRRSERLTETADRNIMPAVSPNGRYVAYAAQTARGFQIHLVDLETRERKPLTSGEGACKPAWSRDGKAIAFVRMGDPSSLETYDIATGTIRKLITDERLWSYYPAYSPDNRHIAFSVSPEHHEGEDWDLAVIDPSAPRGFRRLTKGRGNDRVPDWRPVL